MSEEFLREIRFFYLDNELGFKDFSYYVYLNSGNIYKNYSFSFIDSQWFNYRLFLLIICVS